MEEILKSKMINKSEVARRMGISPSFLKMKMVKYEYSKFTEPQRRKLFEILVEFQAELGLAINKYHEKV